MWGVDEGWIPLSTCLQRHCNPKRTREWEREREKETGKQRTNRETHVESGTNQKDARSSKKAINQTKHNHMKFQNLALTTFFLRRAAFIGKNNRKQSGT